MSYVARRFINSSFKKGEKMSEVLTNGIKVPDKGSRSWYDDMRGDLVKLDALIGSASSVTVNPMLTSGIEIASITVNGTSYSLYQQDSDIAVNIKPVTTNEELPILLSKSSEENTDTVDMSVGVTVNPSTNAITATTFVGALTGNATTATSATKATQDGDGNVISTTYATPTNVADSLQEAKNYVGTATSNMVTTDTTQTITGDKAFSGFLDYLVTINQSEIPTDNIYKNFRFIGNDGLRLFNLQYCSRSYGARDVILYIYNKDGDSHNLQ